jgi:hypothetical protein
MPAIADSTAEGARKRTETRPQRPRLCPSYPPAISLSSKRARRIATLAVSKINMLDDEAKYQMYF